MDSHKKLMYANFQIFFKISLAAMVEIVVTLRAIVDSLKIYIINSLKKKKKIETIFINSIALFSGSTTKTNKINIILLPTSRWNHYISGVQCERETAYFEPMPSVRRPFFSENLFRLTRLYFLHEPCKFEQNRSSGTQEILITARALPENGVPAKNT